MQLTPKQTAFLKVCRKLKKAGCLSNFSLTREAGMSEQSVGNMLRRLEGYGVIKRSYASPRNKQGVRLEFVKNGGG